ncbi:MAG: transposase [Rhodanobacter sp.]
MTQRQWEALSSFLPGKPGDPGRHAADNRSFVNAVLWVLGTGSEWSRLPARFGQYKSVHKRYRRWEENGTWARVTLCLNHDLNTGLPVSSALRGQARSCCGKSVFDLH